MLDIRQVLDLQDNPMYYQYVHIEYVDIHKYVHFYCRYDCYHYDYPNEAST